MKPLRNKPRDEQERMEAMMDAIDLMAPFPLSPFGPSLASRLGADALRSGREEQRDGGADRNAPPSNS
jgi:hypothetical protein